MSTLKEKQSRWAMLLNVGILLWAPYVILRTAKNAQFWNQDRCASEAVLHLNQTGDNDFILKTNTLILRSIKPQGIYGIEI